MTVRQCHLCEEPEDAAYPHRDQRGCIEAVKLRLGNLALRVERMERVLVDLGRAGDMQEVRGIVDAARREFL